MTQVQLKQRMMECRDRLKLATHYADTFLSGPITTECATTLEQMAMKAMAAITTLRSEVSGNEPPKAG